MIVPPADIDDAAAIPAAETTIPCDSEPRQLQDLIAADAKLLSRFVNKLRVDPTLTRPLVSYQASKACACDRWFKFKEAFSAELVQRLLHRFGITRGKLLDPFAGSGTALFTASDLGLDADGVELLPIGQEIVATRLLAERELDAEDVVALERWANQCPWTGSERRQPVPRLRITEGAYPPDTEDAIERFRGAWQSENARVQAVLRFALLCVLESVSYTRKDGQYLRWDRRRGRTKRTGSFHKGPICDFEPAITAKLQGILTDLPSAHAPPPEGSGRSPGGVNLLRGSSLDLLPELASKSYDVIFTSPPYCNRYDYTRTYALELALLGVSEGELSGLRQQMVSCTVENRAKDLVVINPSWRAAIQAADGQELLQLILRYLEEQKGLGLLNNNGIPRMVRGYFYEMACVIQECARVLKPGGLLFMVNDNVRYAGAAVSVDLILSDIAERLGFRTDSILVLPNGKGNSSQQMGSHGREPLRKCVYVWIKV